MGYILGLDIGIASIGYSILATDKAGNPYKIIILNSVLFPVAEVPKTGASLASATRQYRCSRRVQRRSSFRKHRVVTLFLNHGLLDKSTIANFFDFKISHQDIWELRALALHQQLTNEQLFEIFYYFVGHRGFKSNSKAELKKLKDEKDTKPAKSGKTSKNNDFMPTIKRIAGSLEDYPTLDDMMAHSPAFANNKHNKAYQGKRTVIPLRRWIVAEVNTIVDCQRKLGNDAISSDFFDQYLRLLTTQRNFDEGPGEPSRFGGNLIERMVGQDTLDPHEKRAAKATATFARFNLLSRLNSLQICYQVGQPFQLLTKEQRQTLLKDEFKPELSFADIRKKLKLDKDAQFNLTKSNKKESKQFLFKQKSFSQIHDIIADPDKIDEIGTILSLYKSDDNRSQHLRDLNYTEAIIASLLPIQSSTFGNLSLKTMRRILPYLEKGKVYSEAATDAGYDFNKTTVDRKFLKDNINNPVVQRAIAKALKVVKAVTHRYGKPDAIHIELTREIKHNFEERQKIQKKNKHNQGINQNIVENLEENYIPVTGVNIIKKKLYDEQQGIDLYSGKKINEGDIYSEDHFEIDHIIPYSLSFDDSFTNKTLTATHCNRTKGNCTPLEYLAPGEQDAFRARVHANITNLHKQQKLLKEHFTQDDRNQWKSRNINDTGYINRVLAQYFEQNIEFTDKIKKKVVTINGAVTAHIRSQYGIVKNRDMTDLHHAVDAVVLACITPKLIHDITVLSERNEIRFNPVLQNLTQSTGTNDTEMRSRTTNNTLLPWKDFRKELEKRLSGDPSKLMADHIWEHYTPDEIRQLKPAMVIRLANRKVTGTAHSDSTYSPKIYKETGNGLLRTPITKLKYDSKSDSIKGYPLAEDRSNRIVHDALLNALRQHEGDAKKAFPNNELQIAVGGHSQVVTHVKVRKRITLPVQLNHGKGLAINSKMIRLDIFRRATDGDLVGVPVYISDVKAKSLPNRAIKSGSDYSKWYPITDQDVFVTSLVKNDLIQVTVKGSLTLTSKQRGYSYQTNHLLCYFDSISITGNQIRFQSINGDYKINTTVLNHITKITRFSVDYLGNYHPIKREHRRTFK